VTWLVLRGRCKNCGAPISSRYFIVELLTGVLFLGCWLRFGENSPWLAAVFSLFLAGLIVATFIDFEHFIIPDEITFGGAVVGLVISILLPELHAVPTRGQGLLQALIGIGIGAGIVYGILRLGKLFFGQHKIQLPPASRVVFTETALHLPDKEFSYEELFYRKTDTIVLKARTVELIDRGYREVTVRLSPAALQIGDEKFDPEAVVYMEVECTEIVLPREAMGLGDVKFMGAIGAFLGWQGALFSLMASSLIGATVGVVLIVLRRREWSSRMPYGPYIALAAMVWVFARHKIMDALFPH
jgi:leader peptidase (prepilin peptidase)/N-methyltransferase